MGRRAGAAARRRTRSWPRFRDPEFVASLAESSGPRHLDADMELVQDTFRSFAHNVVAPQAEHVHRTNGDVPEDVIEGLAEIGAFGLSVPAEYGGYSEGGDGEYLAMVIATEELSRASLGIGGSLITRPEILTRALVKGGTEEQKQHWLPKLATAEVMAAVAVTEPDYGSDVAGLKVTATPAEGPDGAAGYVINGVKTWCTFAARADVLMLLARTDPDRSLTHRGLSLFIVPKPRGEGHGFQFTQDGHRRGKMEGRPIDTIGYRGMHSYEIALENWWVPADHLIGGDDGPRPGLLLPDGGLRERPAADRGPGDRRDAGGLRGGARLRPQPHACSASNIVDYQLTRAKLGRMAVLIQAGRQFSYHVATLMAKGQGADRGQHGQGLRVQGRRVGHPRGDADPRRLRLRRGVHRQPAVRRRPRAVDLRGRRRDPLPQGHRPPLDVIRVCAAGRPCSRHSVGRKHSGQVRAAR